MKKLRALGLSVLCGSLLACASAGASASASYSGSTTATWTNPVLSGIYVDPGLGTATYDDNTKTAACDLSGCPTQLTGYSSSTVAWGNYPTPLTIPTTSTVTFTPASFSNVAADSVFELGTLTYTNGTSDNVIFGATLTVSVALSGDPTVVQSLVVPLSIVTTQNDGTTAQNADFLDFGTSTFGTTLPVTFNVLEGDTATAILYGSIIGDPQLVASKIVLDADSDGAGFIGNGVPPAVPEPSPWMLMLSGLSGFGWWSRRREKR